VRARRLALLCGIALGAAVTGADASAQTIPRELPGTVEPGRDRAVPLPPPPAQFDFSIEAPRRRPVPSAADELRFDLRDIRIVGATVFSPDELAALYKPLIGARATLAEILSVAEEIEAKYKAAGYVISRAFVPPQEVENGVFTITVVEGYVSRLVFEGGDERTQRRLEQYFEPVLSAHPLDVATLERALLLGNDLPGLAVSGLLRPAADEPGASELVLSLTEVDMTVVLSTDNRGSKFQGPWTLYSDVGFNNWLGLGEQIAVGVSATPDFTEKRAASFRYLQPLKEGLNASFSALVTQGYPAFTLSQLDLVTDSFAAGPRLEYSLWRTRLESLSFAGGFTWQDATVDALGQRLSRDHWRVVDVAAAYTESFFYGGTSAVVLGLAQGLPILGASTPGSAETSRIAGHSDFTKATLNLRRLQPVASWLTVAVSAIGQYSFAPLLAGEEIAFGGTTIGRGYDPGALTGDHGAGASIELRHDERFPELGIPSAQAYLFLDTGKVWTRAASLSSGAALASTGIGVRASLPNDVNLTLEFAKTLIDLPNGTREAARVLFSGAVRF
jgi:hemolysin activation/secretion protein